MNNAINDAFCEEVGIKKCIGYIINADTDEIRFYSNKSSLYKNPKDWINIHRGLFAEPTYPDLLTNSHNFLMLLNVQFDMFKSIGDVYYKTGDETFEECYLKMRIQAIQACKGLGGTPLLYEYLDVVRRLPFDYIKDTEDEG